MTIICKIGYNLSPDLYEFHISNECMQFDRIKKCGEFVQQIMNGKKFILHIQAYFI